MIVKTPGSQIGFPAAAEEGGEEMGVSPQQYLDARLTARELLQDTFDMPEPETKGGDHHTCSSGPAATFTLTLPAQRTTEKIEHFLKCVHFSKNTFCTVREEAL